MRSRISRAARSVKVMATSWLSRGRSARRRRPGSRSARNRSVSTNVLPQPAPAESATDTPRAVTCRAAAGRSEPAAVTAASAVGWHVFSKERT